MIENTTTYTVDNLKVFIKESLRKSRLICFISLAVVIVFGVLNILLEPSDWLFSVIMFAITLVSTLVVLLVPMLYIKKVKSMPTIKNIYQFYPDKLCITSYSNNIEVNKSDWHYSIIKKVSEKGKLLLLYLNNNQALLVDIEAFSGENDKEIVKKYITTNVSHETKAQPNNNQ